MAEDFETLKTRIKNLIVENLMLDTEPAEIQDDEALFGDGLGLDSVDALQLVVALDKQFGLKIPDARQAREVLASVQNIAEAVRKQPGASAS